MNSYSLVFQLLQRPSLFCITCMHCTASFHYTIITVRSGNCLLPTTLKVYTLPSTYTYNLLALHEKMVWTRTGQARKLLLPWSCRLRRRRPSVHPFRCCCFLRCCSTRMMISPALVRLIAIVSSRYHFCPGFCWCVNLPELGRTITNPDLTLCVRRWRV